MKKEFGRPVKQVKTSAMPSKTIPDQSLTIRQIMDRFTRGLPIEGAHTSVFEQTEEVPHPDLPTSDELAMMDIADRQEVIEGVREKAQELEKSAKKRAAEIRSAKRVLRQREMFINDDDDDIEPYEDDRIPGVNPDQNPLNPPKRYKDAIQAASARKRREQPGKGGRA